ncbi:hypothetical protein BDV19DRAFT_359566 [Aspergillus venezuelensis]
MPIFPSLPLPLLSSFPARPALEHCLGFVRRPMSYPTFAFLSFSAMGLHNCRRSHWPLPHCSSCIRDTSSPFRQRNQHVLPLVHCSDADELGTTRHQHKDLKLVVKGSSEVSSGTRVTTVCSVVDCPSRFGDSIVMMGIIVFIQLTTFGLSFQATNFAVPPI